jgi:alanine-synthesizing transaminase
MSKASRRVPADFAPNPLARLLEEKRSAGRSILDLATSNPTHAGLTQAPRGLASALLDPAVLSYDPDPRGMVAARRAVASYYGSREGGPNEIDPDRIILTSSTSEAYAHLFRLLCDPGDEILVPTPSYPLFEPLAHLEGVALRPYELTLREERWQLRGGSIRVGPRTRAVIVVQPNNPTGSRLSPEELEAIVRSCASSEIALISDEVFGDFPWPPRSAPFPTLLGERRCLTFVLSGISKVCGLPQMKLGWIALGGPEEEIDRARSGLEWIADLFLSVGTPIQVALPLLLEARSEFQTAVRERIASNLEILRKLSSQSAGLRILESDGGWSGVLRFDADLARGDDPAHWMLRDLDLLVHPGHFYELPDQDVVVSLITRPEIFEEALSRVAGKGE